MSEDSLKKLSLHDLFDLMLKTVNEILAIDNVAGKEKAVMEKQRQVELRQKVIVTKGTENLN